MSHLSPDKRYHDVVCDGVLLIEFAFVSVYRLVGFSNHNIDCFNIVLGSCAIEVPAR